jgi:hypothetical protein
LKLHCSILGCTGILVFDFKGCHTSLPALNDLGIWKTECVWWHSCDSYKTALTFTPKPN